MKKILKYLLIATFLTSPMLAQTTTTKITGMPFVVIYADKLAPVKNFYKKFFGFKQTAEFAPGEIYGVAGDIEMWIGSGYKRARTTKASTRMSVMLAVDSVGKLFEALKKHNQPIIQDAPIEMMPGTYWLQFKDPAGNIVEVLGKK